MKIITLSLKYTSIFRRPISLPPTDTSKNTIGLSRFDTFIPPDIYHNFSEQNSTFKAEIQK